MQELPINYRDILHLTMAQPVPKTTKQWNVVGYDGLESLKYSEQPVPELGDTEVLVRSKFLADSVDTFICAFANSWS